MSEATGWAVINFNGEIYVRTISDTRRAAIINYLVAERKQMVANYHTDENVEQMWKAFGQYVNVKPVTISSRVDVGGGKVP